VFFFVVFDLFVAGFSARRYPFAVKVLTMMQGLNLFLTNKSIVKNNTSIVSKSLAFAFFLDAPRA
jgi:hypothetical protein